MHATLLGILNAIIRTKTHGNARERCRRAGPLPRRRLHSAGLVGELAERGLKVDYRSVWTSVHAEKLTHKNQRAGPPRRGRRGQRLRRSGTDRFGPKQHDRQSVIYGIDGVGKSLVELVGYLATCWAGGASLLRVDEHGRYAGRTICD